MPWNYPPFRLFSKYTIQNLGKQPPLSSRNPADVGAAIGNYEILLNFYGIVPEGVESSV
jgi:hypothetical protein